jgi:predicted RNA-binding Zn-ribbon protein involved in translation (DUF1610 family)
MTAQSGKYKILPQCPKCGSNDLFVWFERAHVYNDGDSYVDVDEATLHFGCAECGEMTEPTPTAKRPGV